MDPAGITKVVGTSGLSMQMVRRCRRLGVQGLESVVQITIFSEKGSLCPGLVGYSAIWAVKCKVMSSMDKPELFIPIGLSRAFIAIDRI